VVYVATLPGTNNIATTFKNCYVVTIATYRKNGIHWNIILSSVLLISMFNTWNTSSTWN